MGYGYVCSFAFEIWIYRGQGLGFKLLFRIFVCVYICTYAKWGGHAQLLQVVQQVLAADQNLWHIVAQDSRDHVTISAEMPPPLDAHIKPAAANPMVIACTTPLPKPSDTPALRSEGAVLHIAFP